MITLMVITDGRWDYLERTLDALMGHVDAKTFDHWLIVNDAVDPAYAEAIDMSFRFDEHVTNHGQKMGFGGAIQAGWNALPADTDFVFHLEDDFELQRPVDIEAMAAVLTDRPYLLQMALRRQAWAPPEIEAGGVVEMHPQDYDDVSDGHGNHWLEHRLFFTTNPSLYRRSLTDRGWPAGEHSEGRFTQQRISEDPQARFGYWGRRSDPPWVHHIGQQKVGTDY